MSEERNNNQQIIRKDAKGCFVEVLNDSFEIGRVHMFFATYDVNKPEGKRQTNSVAIYLPLPSGVLRRITLLDERSKEKQIVRAVVSKFRRYVGKETQKAEQGKS